MTFGQKGTNKRALSDNGVRKFLTVSKISTFGAWCRAAGMDEWTALQKVVGGDHAAMTFLRFALRWGEAEAVQAAGGWFYQTYAQFAEQAGLTRTQVDRVRKVLANCVGMTEKRQRVRLPGGEILATSVMHYRIDPVALWVAFVWQCLPERARLGLSQRELMDVCHGHQQRFEGTNPQGFVDWQLQQIANVLDVEDDAPEVPEDDAPSEGGTPKVSESGTPRAPESGATGAPESNAPRVSERDTRQSRASGEYKDSRNKTLNQSANSSHKISAPRGAERDVLPDYLNGLRDALGAAGGSTKMVLAAAAGLKPEQAAAVARRCEGTARSWQYVIEALRREVRYKAPQGQHPPYPASDRPASGSFADLFKR